MWGIETPKYHSNEVQKKFEADWYDWDNIKDILEELASREEVDSQLDALEGNSYYTYLKELIDKPFDYQTISILATD